MKATNTTLVARCDVNRIEPVETLRGAASRYLVHPVSRV